MADGGRRRTGSGRAGRVPAPRLLIALCLTAVLLPLLSGTADAVSPAAAAAANPAMGRSAVAVPAAGGSRVGPVTHGGRRAHVDPSSVPAVSTPGAVPPFGAPPDPTTNFTPSPAFPNICFLAPDGLPCVNTVIAALNNARHRFGQPSYSLPATFAQLTPATQLLLLTNSDRALYSLPPVLSANATLDAAALVGARANDDPRGPDTVNGQGYRAWTANWAGGYPALVEAYYEWMWDDGLGSNNIDCTTADTGGCWGHRHDTLFNFDTPLLYMGYGLDNSTATSIGVLYWASNGAPITQRPVVTSTSPVSVHPGTTVTVKGYGFNAATAVYAGIQGVGFRKVDANTLTFVAPGLTGVKAITVSGTSATSDVNTPARISYLTPPVAGSYQPILPTRVLDTRTGQSAPRHPLAANGTLSMGITGLAGIPAGASAVMLNVTAVTPARPGNLTVYPDGVRRPASSNLNLQPGVTTADAVLVKIGQGGRIDFSLSSPAGIDLVADAMGYVVGGAAAGAGATVPVVPARLLDTRTTLGGHPGAVPSSGTVSVRVAGLGGVPNSGVSAVLVTLTAVTPAQPGSATAWSGSGALPGASALNYRPGQTTPNLALVPVGPTGRIAVRNNSIGAAHLLVDVAGYVTAGTPAATGGTVPIAPVRMLDSRTGLGLGPYAPFTTAPPAGTGGWGISLREDWSVQVTGRGGVPLVGVSAVVLNVTAVHPTDQGNVAVYPTGGGVPNTSTVNFIPGQDVPNVVVAPVGPGGLVNFHVNGPGLTALLADVTGYVLTP